MNKEVDDSKDILINLDSIKEKLKHNPVIRVLHDGQYLNFVNHEIVISADVDNIGFCINGLTIKIRDKNER